MILGDFILTLIAIIFLAILIVRWRVTGEASFWDYIFCRGIHKYLIKAFAIVYIILITVAWISVYLESHPINKDFLYYRLW